MTNFWDIIVETNTFNFAILAIIIAVVLTKINIPELTEKIRKEIAKQIENARLEKQNAQDELKSAKRITKNTDTEVNEKLQGAKNNAKLLSDEIKKNTEEQIQNINANIERVISSEEKKMSAKLKSDTMKNAIELARQDITSKLDTKLHEKLIEQSIKELS